MNRSGACAAGAVIAALSISLFYVNQRGWSAEKKRGSFLGPANVHGGAEARRPDKFSHSRDTTAGGVLPFSGLALQGETPGTAWPQPE